MPNPEDQDQADTGPQQASSQRQLDYHSVTAGQPLEDATRRLIRIAIQEDLSNSLDWTTVCLIEPDQTGQCAVVAREEGVAAGMATIPWIIDEFDADLEATCQVRDGDRFHSNQSLIKIRGNTRDMLTAERTILNLVSRLCGIATLTARYITAMNSKTARLYDTRKTTPGWRLLEKYAVRCGGAHNHRTGLYDGFLIKDNHLALAGTADTPLSITQATERAMQWRGGVTKAMKAHEIVEVEVDTLEQLREVLTQKPNIALLDNFKISELQSAVALRNSIAPTVELEASGNVREETIGEIASTGVDRISSGALTHQATSLDLGLDWSPV